MSHPHRMSLGRVESSPVKPSPRFCRAVLAQIFNRDNWQNDVTWAEAAVITGAKLLKDAGHEDDHITAIFRFFRDSIIRWVYEMDGVPNIARNMLVLVIMDNRRASLVGVPYDLRVFDFRHGVEATGAPVPILQLSVTLSALLGLLVVPAELDWSDHAAKEEPVAASPGHPDSP